MGFYAAQVLPRLVDVALRSDEITALRKRVVAGLEGEVLEVGFGSGLNVPHYPPAVRSVVAVDPALVGRKLAARRLAEVTIPVEFVGLDGEDLPLDDASVDHVLTTWTLCSIPDVGRALAEICRVLRPNGALHFLEHGRSPEPRIARWQVRLAPVQQRILGGCRLNRPIDHLVVDAGLRIARLDNYYLTGPKPLGYVFEGIAAKSAV